MTSNSDYKITIDDDDDFDWDAAVREIEAACQVSKLPSTSSCLEQPSPFAPPNNHDEKKKSGTSSSRQSTLHEFVGKAKVVPRPQVKVFQEQHFGNERLPAVQIDVQAAKTWIYPVNVPLRDYQFAITQKALFSNTLVALPTGLGKTLIAAVVMYNYFRWFPDGKIVFAAPSRPLVMQQIEACHNIVGIPQEWTIDMTGQINPTKRACFWKSKRVFFVTPQVLEKDIQSGTCLVNHMVCLVIDEAHRALGNYSYCVAIRQLMDVPVQLRILALSATPGSKQQTIQKIIDNLHISTLEYRNENDHDVIPYVHNRKLELIQVPMGKEAVEIHNKLLEIIRPYVTRLCAAGVLPNRDFQTLSPCELLNSRDKFRQAPPLDLSHIKYGEIEGYFGVLITLYHIRKLLSSHGIRPAYEMLEEKLKQGLFARYMSKNEDLFKARLKMQQSLSHGAQSPKLSKMLEVLIDHFKAKDPGSSRVIIFSNFRGSVRDIMDALANIEDIVRAAQFIGQSSGKALKGQSQKVQQAVLEKFRAGGYNVIVATSIGEEGLDIMEVDLVICFDANVSPLRMIQRMGRTGRKHDGRVVVLACEGSELKGYMRKQANGKTVRKHMLNGGMNSFNFHCSPRMIPHIFKPEVQFVKFSIEEFIRRGKKVKDNETVETPVFIDKLTDAEANLIAKYFSPPGDVAWKPSLIAFPHFQTFPSRVHKVLHSCKTTLLIDAMQNLQGLHDSKGKEVSLPEDEVLLERCLGVDNLEHHDDEKDFLLFDEFSKQSAQEQSFGYTATGIFEAEGKKSICNSPNQNPQKHSYLFGSDFISVDPLGKVLIVSVPLLSSKEVAHPQHTSVCNVQLLDYSNQDFAFLRTSVEDHKKLPSQTGGLVTSKTKCAWNGITKSGLCKSNASQDKTLDEIENVPMTPDLKGKLPQERDGFCETLDAVEVKVSTLLPDEHPEDFRDSEFSPRLTNMIHSGIVPESPDKCSDCLSPAQPCIEAQTKPSVPMENEMVTINSKACESNVSVFPTKDEIQTPIRSNGRGYTFTSPSIGKASSPLINYTNNSCSNDWCLSENNSGSIKQARKLKRLRKAGDCEKNNDPESIKDSSLLQVTDFVRSFTSTSAVQHKHGRGNKKRAADSARVFIEEEAEVSTDADISDDEEDNQENNSCDSFIDDRINPTVVDSQSENRTDMMAIYRRSLLSQSPMLRQPTAPASDSHSPASMAPITRTSDTGSSSKAFCSVPTPQTDSANHSTSRDSKFSRMNEKSEVVAGTTDFSSKHDSDIETRKRKLSYCSSTSLPAINLEKEFELQFEAASRSLQDGEANENMLSDDIFFEGLDLDAIEAQAALLLKQKLEASAQKPEIIHQTHPEKATFCSPSFDLGI